MKLCSFIKYAKSASKAVELIKRMQFSVLPLTDSKTYEIVGYRFIHSDKDCAYISDVSIQSLGVSIRNQTDRRAVQLEYVNGVYTSKWEVKHGVTVREMENQKELEIARAVVMALNTELEYEDVQNIAKLCRNKGGRTIEECWSRSDYYDRFVKYYGGRYTLYKLIDTMNDFRSNEEEIVGNMRNWC